MMLEAAGTTALLALVIDSNLQSAVTVSTELSWILEERPCSLFLFGNYFSIHACHFCARAMLAPLLLHATISAICNTFCTAQQTVIMLQALMHHLVLIDVGVQKTVRFRPRTSYTHTTRFRHKSGLTHTTRFRHRTRYRYRSRSRRRNSV